ncbi:MAG: type II toxin-antitoxin system HigB family toxin [Candidatus Obscuribacter sp.]|nr:type II toxin-antitoxin system HigB family toxin [Candidatus Obscuribacter sp.]
MEILNSRAIKQFIQLHAEAEAPLNDWVTKVRAAQWKSNADVQRTFKRADHLGDQKFIFNIGGNSFRMAAMVWIENEKVYFLKLMTNSEYDRVKF